MVDLSKIGQRGRLKPKSGDEPHWQRLRSCCFLGYRPSKKGGSGTWFVRVYEKDSRRYLRKALGDFANLAGNEVFTAAKRDAETWADEVEAGGLLPNEIVTVEDACRAYLLARPGSIAEGVFRRHVYGDPISKVRIDQLRRRHLREWRTRLENAPASVSRNKRGEKKTKIRSNSTVNRDMVPLRAALNRVLAQGKPGSEAAWQEALAPFKGAGAPRTLYLSPEQRQSLVANVADDAKPFVRAMCMMPLRPGALAHLQVRDFEPRTRTLTIGKDKTGRPRQIGVPKGTAKFLSEQAHEKAGVDYLFSRADGAVWNKDKWKHPIKAAVAGANLPGETSAYTIRHSVITDLVMARVPLLVVAKLADTGVHMIERHYGHLLQDAAEEALEKLTI